MTAPLSIPFARDPAYLPGDVVVAALDAEGEPDELPDRWQAAGSQRDRAGFGFGNPGSGSVPFGRLVVPAARVPFGLGAFGVGAERVDLVTRERFASGDDLVRLRVGDGLPAEDGEGEGLGNASGWSDWFVVHHRLTSDEVIPPQGVRVDAGVLRWTV